MEQDKLRKAGGQLTDEIRQLQLRKIEVQIEMLNFGVKEFRKKLENLQFLIEDQILSDGFIVQSSRTIGSSVDSPTVGLLYPAGRPVSSLPGSLPDGLGTGPAGRPRESAKDEPAEAAGFFESNPAEDDEEENIEVISGPEGQYIEQVNVEEEAGSYWDDLETLLGDQHSSKEGPLKSLMEEELFFTQPEKSPAVGPASAGETENKYFAQDDLDNLEVEVEFPQFSRPAAEAVTETATGIEAGIKPEEKTEVRTKTAPEMEPPIKTETKPDYKTETQREVKSPVSAGPAGASATGAGPAGASSTGASSTAASPTGVSPAGASPAVEKEIKTLRYKYLGGKLAGADLLDGKGRVIVRKNELITPEIVDKAETEGKLAELIVNMTIPGLEENL